MNKVILIGHVTADIDVSYSGKGTAFATFSIATNSYYDGKEYVSFHRCKAFGKAAENISEFVSKGDKIAVEGRGQSGDYIGDSGRKVYTYEILIDRFDLMSKPQKKEETGKKPEQRRGR